MIKVIVVCCGKYESYTIQVAHAPLALVPRERVFRRRGAYGVRCLWGHNVNSGAATAQQCNLSGGDRSGTDYETRLGIQIQKYREIVHVNLGYVALGDERAKKDKRGDYQ